MDQPKKPKPAAKGGTQVPEKQGATQSTPSDETVVPASLPGDDGAPGDVDVAVNMASSKSQTVPNRPAPAQPKNIRQAGITQLGDFKVIKKLGAGAMGEVYRAHQVSLDREVALKVLSKARSKDKMFVERFKREARVMARLDHPNVIRSFGVGDQDGWHYLAMEFVDGGSVEDWQKKAGGKFSLGDALRIVIDCARGLEHAHELKMVHRDIKPGNVLITTRGVVKVADLGLAKATDEDMSLTTSGVGAGTPYYMSPEQTRNAKHVDGRSDIYALGCMLYLFLVGEQPFKGNTPLELIEAKEKGRFMPARRLDAELPERLDLIIDKMLARNPDSRYQTCTELIADLEGLGLAHDTLSFIEAPAPKAAATRVSMKPAAATQVPAAPAARTMTPAPVVDKDIWYVKLRGPDKKLVRRKATTAQLRELIKSPNFDEEAEASHDPNEGYRRLSTYREFAGLFQGRVVKAKVERKMEQARTTHGDLEAMERRARRWRAFKKRFGGVFRGLMLLVWIAAIAIGGYVLWQIGSTFLK